MLNLSDITQLIADNFTGGDVTIAGMLIFTVCLALVFIFVRNLSAALIISMPMAFIFSTLGIVSQDMMILLVIIAVLGLAFASRKAWSDD